MNRASRYVNRAGKRGIRWGAVVLGWVAAVLAGIMIGLVLGGLYNWVAEGPVERGEAATAAFIIPLLAGFLAYLIGGYVAGRRAGVSGGLNGAMTAIFGLLVNLLGGYLGGKLGEPGRG